MTRGIETSVVLLVAFVVLPFTVLIMVGGHVPAGLWVALSAACLAVVPAHRWSQR